jgi:Flp pilus assembly protein TadD
VWDLEQYRAEILQVSKGPAAALPDVEAYASRNWWHMDSHLMLARLHIAAGDYTDALAECNDAATLDIHSPIPFQQAARARVLAHQVPQAAEAQAAAIARSPEEPGQYMMLAAILNQMNRPDQAMAAEHEAEVVRAGGAGG